MYEPDVSQGLPAQTHEVVLELIRARDPSSPLLPHFEPQPYVRRWPDNRVGEALFAWTPELLQALIQLHTEQPDPERVARLGQTLRRFLQKLDFAVDEQECLKALKGGHEVSLCLCSNAAEIHALPWELLPLDGRPIGSRDRFSVQYAWPGVKQVSAHRISSSGRILFAWSAAGGFVPAEEHLALLRSTATQGAFPFDPKRDVVSNVSLSALDAALRAQPTSVLHLLCHGAGSGEEGLGLCWNAPEPGRSHEWIDAGRLADVLQPYTESLRMVVLCACHSGYAGPGGSLLGSMAQALHRLGIPAVVASRFPLSLRGSTVLTKVLYRGLLGDSTSVQQALAQARHQLRVELDTLDWASLQLYAPADAGTDLRPLVLRPYRGLLPFDSEHRHFFFGRQPAVDEVLERLQAAETGSRSRFQVVAGASGVGKSSLVLAGILPRLIERGWQVEVVRPTQATSPAGIDAAEPKGSTALRLLAERLRSLHAQNGQVPAYRGLRQEVLFEASLRVKAHPHRRLLLVVDQFEEIFTHFAPLSSEFESSQGSISAFSERHAFVRTLWMLAQARELEIIVLLIVREDVFVRCGEISLDNTLTLGGIVSDTAHRVFIPALQPSQLEEIIEAPARRVGLELEPGLVQDLIKEAAQQAGGLPLLQHALDLLWQKRQGRKLTHAALAGLKGLAGVVSQTCEEVHSSLSAAQQHQARRLFLKLIHDGVEEGLRLRRRVVLDDVIPLGDEARTAFFEVVDHYVSRRLMVIGCAPDAPDLIWLELAHEALLKQWKRIDTWVLEGWSHEHDLRLIEAWAKDWWEHRGSKDETSWLLTGDKLSFSQNVFWRDQGSLSQRAWRFLMESRRQENEKVKLRARRRIEVASLLVQIDPTQAVLVLLEVDPTMDSGLEKEWRRVARLSLASPVSTAVLRGKGAPLSGAVFSPKGDAVVTASSDGMARLFRSDGRGDPIALQGHSAPVRSAAFSPDGNLVVTASEDCIVCLFRAVGKGEPLRLVGHTARVRSATFSPDGTRVLTASKDGTARIFRTDARGEPLVLRGHTKGLMSAVFSSDGSRVVTASEDGTACLFQANGKGEPLVLRGHQKIVRTAAFSPDGQFIVTASQDGTARVWRADGKGEPRVLRGHKGSVNSAVFSPDSAFIVTASSDRVARLFRTCHEEALQTFTGHDGGVQKAAFSPDGLLVVTASKDCSASLFRVHDASNPWVFRGHRLSVRQAVFSQDGSRIVTASADGTARVWSTTGALLPTPPGGSDIGSEGGTSPAGAYVTPTPRQISESELSTDTLKTLLRRATTASLTVEERKDYLSESPEDAKAGHQRCEHAQGRHLVPWRETPPPEPEHPWEVKTEPNRGEDDAEPTGPSSGDALIRIKP